VADHPDPGEFTAANQQPVDFGVWQAAEGTWQLESGAIQEMEKKCQGMSRSDKENRPNFGKMAGSNRAPAPRAVCLRPFVSWRRVSVPQADFRSWAEIVSSKALSFEPVDLRALAHL